MAERVAKELLDRGRVAPELVRGTAFFALVEERVRATGCASAAEYLRLLGDRPEEWQRLLGLVSVPETWLFRYPESFNLLQEELLRMRGESGGSLGAGPLALCVGCASGAEPYSVAAVMSVALGPADEERVVAIDRNPEVLAMARMGRLGQFASRETMLPKYEGFFAAGTNSGRSSSIQVAQELVDTVRFLQSDVLEGEPSITGVFPFVFCRNVAIYLNPQARAQLYLKLESWLAPGGMLFLGHADPAPSGGFGSVGSPGSFAFRRAKSPAPMVGNQPERAISRTLNPAAPMAAKPLLREAAPQPVARPSEMDASSRARRLRALADAGNLTEARAEGEALDRSGLADAEVFELLAAIAMAEHQHQRAESFLVKSLYLEPTRETSLLALAAVLERLGRSDDAQRTWARARRGLKG